MISTRGRACWIWPSNTSDGCHANLYFGLIKDEQYSLKYRTIREIEEAERQLKAETEQVKVSEDFEESMQDDLLTEDLD